MDHLDKFKRKYRSSTVGFSNGPSCNLRPKRLLRRPEKEGFLYFVPRIKTLKEKFRKNHSSIVAKYSNLKEDNTGQGRPFQAENKGFNSEQLQDINNQSSILGTEERAHRKCCREMEEIMQQGRIHNETLLGLLKRLETIVERCEEHSNEQPSLDQISLQLIESTIKDDLSTDFNHEIFNETDELETETQLSDETFDAPHNSGRSAETLECFNDFIFVRKQISPPSELWICSNKPELITTSNTNINDNDSCSVSSIRSSEYSIILENPLATT